MGNLRKQRLARLLRRVPWTVRLMQMAWRRLRQPWITVGVLGAVFNDVGQLLIVEHVFHPICPWGLPGGWMERNEDPARTIVRELHEETGLSVIAERPLLIRRSPELRAHLDIAYLCRCEPGPITLNAELLDYSWVDPTDLPLLLAFHREVVQAALAARTPGAPSPPPPLHEMDRGEPCGCDSPSLRRRGGPTCPPGVGG